MDKNQYYYRVIASLIIIIILYLALIYNAMALPPVDAPGDGGFSDSTVSVRAVRGIGQDGKTKNLDASGGDLMFSQIINFDMAVDASETVYTRGIQNLYDSTFYGGKYLEMENFIGQYVYVLVYYPVSLCQVTLDIEQSAYYDSTTFTKQTGYNYGYIKTDELFPGTGGIVGLPDGDVGLDSFMVRFPVVRLKFEAQLAVNSGTFYVSMYTYRPAEQFAAPNGEYKSVQQASKFLQDLSRMIRKN